MNHRPLKRGNLVNAAFRGANDRRGARFSFDDWWWLVGDACTKALGHQRLAPFW
jgi:hypothetical protein